LLTLEAKMEKANKLLQEGLNKHQICQQLGLGFYVFNKLLQMTEDERVAYFKDSLQVQHEEKIARKIMLIDEVSKAHNLGHSMRKIAKELDISRHTVSQYLKSDVIAVHGSYGAKRKSILDPYLNEIDALINQGYTCNKIEEIIRQKGYTGSSTLLRYHRSKFKKYLYEKQHSSGEKVQDTETLNRSLLLKVLYNPVSKIKNLSLEQLEKVYDKYPMFKKIIDLVNRFKTVLKGKHVENLDKWIEEAVGLENREVSSFINGITRDITAVKNAIQYDYNNGLAEGSVNKLKVIKRIMYGRCSFEMLRKKILRRESCPFN
jgi:transposase